MRMAVEMPGKPAFRRERACSSNVVVFGPAPLFGETCGATARALEAE